MNESRRRSDWESEEGGYCAADGSVQYSRDAANTAKGEELPGPRAEYVEAQPPPPHPDAVKGLAAKHLKPKLPASRPSTDDNESRTAARKPGVELSAGVTSSGDAVYASAALVKGRRDYADVDILSASGQVGAQSEVQVGVARAAASPAWFRGSAELLTARAAAGIHNPDGSTGINLGAGAHLFSLKAGVESGAASLSIAPSLGIGENVSIGMKEVDGETAACASAPLGPVTVSACMPVVSTPDSPIPNDGAEGAGGNDDSNAGAGGARGIR